MVYESGFTTRRTYTTRPIVTSYSVTTKKPIDWEKCPFVPRPSLISDPVTAFGRNRIENTIQQRSRPSSSSILDPINRAAIKPNYKLLHEPIKPYVSTRDKNRERILNMVRHYIDTVEAGGNTAARTSSDSLDTVLPRKHRAVTDTFPVRRETYRNEKSGAIYPMLTKVSRVYKTSYPIYSTGVYTRGNRVITSPVRVVTSPTRYITRVIRSPSPVRIVRTTRVISSPEPTSTYSYTTPIYSYSLPSLTTTSSPYLLPTTRYLSSYTTPSYMYTPISRLYTRSLSPVRITTTPVRVTPSYLKRTTLPGYGARALTNYLGTEPYTVFKEEADRIRHRAQSLIRDVHTPVPRYSRSTTPFPSVLGWEPYDKLALDAYVARITNPVRHVAKEVHKMSMYPEPARKYVGKSHLASIRICGNRPYDIRKPLYDTDRIQNDINLLSWYLRHPTTINKKEKSTLDDDNVEKTMIENAETEDPELDPYRPSRKFSAPRSLDDPEEDEMKEKQRLRQERLMTLKEEPYDMEAELAKQKAERLEEKKRREQKLLEDEAKRKAEEAAAKKKIEEESKAKEEAARMAEEKARLDEEERLRKAKEEEEEKQKALKEANEAAKRAKEEEAARKRQAEEEERKRKLEEEEKARLAEEARKAAEEEAARLAAEEEAQKAAEAARLLAEEQRKREEELQRLAEIEKQAEEEKEAELARQAAELAEIARQESELAAQELEAMQQKSEADASEASEVAEVEKITHNEISADEPVVEEPLTPIPAETDADVPPSQEPTIEMNQDGGDALDSDDLDYSSEDVSVYN